MKKQLVLLSLLVGAVSLQGMKPQKINENEVYMGALAIKKSQDLIALKHFTQFDEYAGNYFKETAKQEERKYILDWIEHWLPVIVYYTQDDVNNPESTFVTFAYKIIDNFATGKTSKELLLKDEQKANDLLSAIYLLYLGEHPDKVCGVLATYFDKRVIDNVHYRSFMRTMLKILIEYVSVLLDSQHAEQVIKERWRQIISSIDKYLEDFVSLPKKEELCERYLKALQNICSELKKMEQGNYKVNISQIPLVHEPAFELSSLKEQDIIEEQIRPEVSAAFMGSLLMQQQQQKKQQLAEVLTVASVANKAFEKPEEVEQVSEINQASSEPTFWDKLADGWNRFLNMLKLMGGV